MLLTSCNWLSSSNDVEQINVLSWSESNATESPVDADFELVEDWIELMEWTVFEEDYPIDATIQNELDSINISTIGNDELKVFISQTRENIEWETDEAMKDAIIERGLHTVRYVEQYHPDNIETIRLYWDIYDMIDMPSKAVYQYKKILDISSDDQQAWDKVKTIIEDWTN